MFAHSIKGCRPLRRACGVLIPSPCVNTTPEPFTLKVRRPRLFRFFRWFPRINVGGDSARFPSLEDAPVSLASPSRWRVGCDKYLSWFSLSFVFLSFYYVLVFISLFGYFCIWCICFLYHVHICKNLFIHAWHVHLCTHSELLRPYTQVHGNIGSGGWSMVMLSLRLAWWRWNLS